jgi:biopolymer transport protein ExbD
MSRKKRRKTIKYRDVELNIMPFIDVFSLLNTFLLMSAVFLAIGVIEVQIPFLSTDQTNKDDDKYCSVKVDQEKTKIEASAENCKGVDAKKELKPDKAGLADLHRYMVDIRRNNPTTDKIQFYSEDDVLWKDIAKTLDAVKLRGPGDPVFQPKSDSQADRAAAMEFVFPKVVLASVML